MPFNALLFVPPETSGLYGEAVYPYRKQRKYETSVRAGDTFARQTGCVVGDANLGTYDSGATWIQDGSGNSTSRICGASNQAQQNTQNYTRKTLHITHPYYSSWQEYIRVELFKEGSNSDLIVILALFANSTYANDM